MSAKAIYEYSGKELIYKHLQCNKLIQNPFVTVNLDSNWDNLTAKNPWLTQQVIKFLA